MAHELFAKHLFLDLPSESDDTTLEEPHLPVLDTATRQLIVDTIMMLIKDDMQNYMYLMKLVTALVPHPPEDGGLFSPSLPQYWTKLTSTRLYYRYDPVF